MRVNKAVNENLQQQVMALYRQLFIENTSAARRECRADEYFDISIGKTPPRSAGIFDEHLPIQRHDLLL